MIDYDAIAKEVLAGSHCRYCDRDYKCPEDDLATIAAVAQRMRDLASEQFIAGLEAAKGAQVPMTTFSSALESTGFVDGVLAKEFAIEQVALAAKDSK